MVFVGPLDGAARVTAYLPPHAAKARSLMGKFDRRHSMKMRRRKGQVKKKERLVRRAESASKRTSTPAPTPAKKSRKAPPPKASAPAEA
jgi:hypothetical protein